MAPIAPKQGAENKLKVINENADSPVKVENNELASEPNNALKASGDGFEPKDSTAFAVKLAIIPIVETTFSLATKPWIAETEAPQFNVPNIG